MCKSLYKAWEIIGEKERFCLAPKYILKCLQTSFSETFFISGGSQLIRHSHLIHFTSTWKKKLLKMIKKESKEPKEEWNSCARTPLGFWQNYSAEELLGSLITAKDFLLILSLPIFVNMSLFPFYCIINYNPLWKLLFW